MLTDGFVRNAYAAGIRKAASLSAFDERTNWIERFKGTPLFDSAMALAQEELHQEAEELQSRQTQQQFYSEGDRLRIQKKLLELELARMSMPQEAPSEIPMAAPAGAPGIGTVPTIPEDVPKTAAPIELLRQMAKQANLGSAALNFIGRNPGLAAGTVGGAVIGGVRGAQQKIDPTTGQPTGGGVMGALGGAALGGAAGGALGLGAQGAVRSAVGAKRVVGNYANKGLQAPGGFVEQLADQGLWRARAFGNDVKNLGGALGRGVTGAQDSLGTLRKNLAAHTGATKLPVVAPAPVVNVG